MSGLTEKQIEKLASGSLWEVRPLLDQGVDVNACSGTNQETALYRAVLQNNIGNVSFLLRAGANVNARTSTGDTPLHCAAEYGILDVLWLLVAHGAEIDAKNNKGETPLHRSVRHTNIAKTLLQAGANRILTDNCGQTPLHIARLKFCRETRELLE